MQKYNDPSPVNIGSGHPISIRDLATSIAAVVGFSGPIQWDVSKPDGTPQRALDGSKMLSLGWRPRVKLCDGLGWAYRDFLDRELAPHAKLIYDSQR
jgi:GDP-L-fucose synthase